MNIIASGAIGELVVLGIQPGEMLLESVERATAERAITNGVVISGIGTLKTCRLHHIEHCDFPPDDRIFTLRKPLELLSVSGIIADGEPHLHVVVSYRDEDVYAGHLEDSSEVLYLAEIAILRCDDLNLVRKFDQARGVSLLDAKT